jgi:hypothetical protein
VTAARRPLSHPRPDRRVRRKSAAEAGLTNRSLFVAHGMLQ